MRESIKDWSHQVVFGLGHVGVVGPQLALVDLECAAVVVHHLLVLSLVLTQQRQVIQLLRHVGVVLPQNLSTSRTQNNNNDDTSVYTFLDCSRQNQTLVSWLSRNQPKRFVHLRSSGSRQIWRILDPRREYTL